MRLSFLRESETVCLGGRSVRVGPLAVRFWRGRRYVIGPASFLGVLQFGNLLAGEGLLPLLDHPPTTWPVAVLRAVAPLLTGQPIRPRALRRASEAELRALARAFLRVNDWARLSAAMRPGDGKPAEDDAFDRGMAAIGREYGLWPYEVMSKPYVEVEAVLDAMRRDAGGISKDTADFVIAKQAEHDAERERADAKLRALGVPVA